MLKNLSLIAKKYVPFYGAQIVRKNFAHNLRLISQRAAALEAKLNKTHPRNRPPLATELTIKAKASVQVISQMNHSKLRKWELRVIHLGMDKINQDLRSAFDLIGIDISNQEKLKSLYE